MPKCSEKTPKKKATDAKKKATDAKKKAIVAKKKTSTCTASQLLGVIAQISALRGGTAPRDLVAKRAGYGTPDNGSFKKALSRAASKGLLNNSDKEVLTLTDKGQKEAGEAPPVETNDDAHKKIKEELSAKMVKAFDIMADGKPHARTGLAAALGYKDIKDQGFKKLLDRIRMKGYLENLENDMVQLTDICFPAGREE